MDVDDHFSLNQGRTEDITMKEVDFLSMGDMGENHVIFLLFDWILHLIIVASATIDGEKKKMLILTS